MAIHWINFSFHSKSWTQFKLEIESWIKPLFIQWIVDCVFRAVVYLYVNCKTWFQKYIAVYCWCSSLSSIFYLIIIKPKIVLVSISLWFSFAYHYVGLWPVVDVECSLVFVCHQDFQLLFHKWFAIVSLSNALTKLEKYYFRLMLNQTMNKIVEYMVKLMSQIHNNIGRETLNEDFRHKNINNSKYKPTTEWKLNVFFLLLQIDALNTIPFEHKVLK